LKATLKFFTTVFFFWVAFFMTFRIVFLVYHSAVFNRFPIGEKWEVLWHGLYMDASMAGYASLIPFLLWSFGWLIETKTWHRILNGYGLLLIIFFSFVLSADLEIYANWGHRVDSAVMPYLQYPEEAFASAYSSPLFLLVGIFLAASIFFSWSGYKLTASISFPEKYRISLHLSGILFAAVLILPIRGGFQLAPMNQSSVYFSTERPLNQAAENGVWVLMQSLLESGNDAIASEYVRSDPKDVDSFLERITIPDGPSSQVVSSTKPNVVLIVWESLTAKVVGSLQEGSYPSTPNLDQLAKDGILFTNFYASGDRSDKGLAAILASVPALGKVSIMANPNMTARLSFLNKSMEKNGYQSAFMYGGELEFANMKSFMLNAGYQKLIGKQEFPLSSYNSKWGAHDEVLFDRQLAEADKAKSPFFHTMFTLTSHEPFEVPGVANKPGESVDSLFCRSHRYTDRCLGKWIQSASKKPWWNNTLVVIVADHGHAHPGHSGESDTMKYKIPMVWYGPALTRKGMKVPVLGSQTDLFKTIMTQLHDSASAPRHSHNLMGQQPHPFAFYSFRYGSVFLQDGKRNELLDPSSVSGPASRYRQWVFESFYRNSSSSKP
jgi:phosphoglycerol transferase MdoB-like AlkP superfamily enzyme